MASKTIIHLLADGTQLPIEIRWRQNNRNVHIHYEGDDGSFWVSAPVHVKEEAIRAILQKNEDWLVKQLTSAEAPHELRYRGMKCEITANIADTLEARVELAADSETARIWITAPSREEAIQALRTWWQRQLFQLLRTEMKKWNGMLVSYGLLLPEIAVRPLRRSWGICYPEKNRIHFNMMLLSVPPKALEYVVLHEAAHLIYPDHGADFRRLLSERMPDWKERRALLKGERAEMGDLTLFF